MIIPLLALSLAVPSMAGTWRIDVDGRPENVMYLIVRDCDVVELYDYQWYPFDVRRVEADGDHARLEFFPEGRPLSMTLDVTADGDSGQGILTIQTPQFPMQSDVACQRIVRSPVDPPVEVIQRQRQGKKIDIVSYLLKNAPRDSLEAWVRFWEEGIQKEFYPFLGAVLGSSPEIETKRRQVLEKLFKQVEGVGDVGTLMDSVSEGPNSANAVVIMPRLSEQGETSLTIASLRKEYPPGYRPCCGDKLYEFETFRIVPVELKPRD